MSLGRKNTVSQAREQAWEIELESEGQNWVRMIVSEWGSPLGCIPFLKSHVDKKWSQLPVKG